MYGVTLLKSFEIRSLTLHYPVVDWSNLDRDLQSANEMLERLNTYLKKEYNINVWTNRLTLNTPPQEVTLGDIIKAIDRSGLDATKTLISLGGFSPSDKRVSDLRESLVNGLYSYLIISNWEDVLTASRLLISWSEEPYEHMTRVGVDLRGDPSFVTPYFPISQSPSFIRQPSISIALKLPRLMLDAYEEKGNRGLIEALYSASVIIYQYVIRGMKEVLPNADIVGIDLSLSPWMEESVGELIERVGKCTIGGFECIPVVFVLNKIINAIASMLPKVTGFNEIMLAVGEDNLLKQRVYEGKLDLRSLIEMVPVCLAGLDMIALRADENKLSNLLSVLKSYSESKQKTVGFRAILLPPDFSDEKIETKKFGDIPVLGI